MGYSIMFALGFWLFIIFVLPWIINLFKSIDRREEATFPREQQAINNYIRKKYLSDTRIKIHLIKTNSYLSKTYSYINHCWNCKSGINSDYNVKCPKCGWYICSLCNSCSMSCSHGSTYIAELQDLISEIQKYPDDNKWKALLQKEELYYTKILREVEDAQKLEVTNRLKEIDIQKVMEENKKMAILKEVEKQRIIKESETIAQLEKAKQETEQKIADICNTLRVLNQGSEVIHKKFGKMIILSVENNIITANIEGKTRQFVIGSIFAEHVLSIK